MKRVLCTVLSICILACSLNGVQLNVQAADERPPFLVFEADMEWGDSSELFSYCVPANQNYQKNMSVVSDPSDDKNKIMRVTSGSAMFYITPDNVCTGSDIMIEYRLKVSGQPAPKQFWELARVTELEKGGGKAVLLSRYSDTGGFGYRTNGGRDDNLSNKPAKVDRWYRYELRMKNLSDPDRNKRRFDIKVYEQDQNGNETLYFEANDKLNNDTSVDQFTSMRIYTRDSDVYFDDIKIYTNNEAELTEEYKLRSDRDVLEYSALTDEPSDQITSDLKTPPTTVPLKSAVTWKSSRPEIINPTDGTIVRPEEDTEVTLTAQLRRPGVDMVLTKEFVFTVLADDRSDQEVVDDRASRLDLEGKDHIIFDFPLPETAGYGTAVTWSVDPNPVIKIDGYGAMVTRPEQDTEVTLHAVVSRNDATATKDIVVKVLKKDAEKVICNPYEDFEQYSDDATELKNWILSPGDGVIAKATIDGVSALKLLKPSGSAPTNAVLDFSEQTDNSIFVARVKATGLHTDSKVLSLSQADGESIDFMNVDGELLANVYGTEADLGEFPEDEWFTLKVDINHNERLVDIYVNGAKKASDISAGDHAPAICKAAAELSGNTSGEISIDYLKGCADFYRDIDLTIDQIDFSNIDTNNITTNFNLLTEGVNSTQISWRSDQTSVINVVDGVAQVTRPAPDEEDAVVKLTAAVSNPLVSKEVSFDFKVLRNLSDQEIVELDLAKIELPSEISTDATKQINLPVSGENGSVMSWESSNTNVIGTDGKVYSIGYDGSAVETVKLTVTISHGNAARTKVFDVAVHRINFAVDTYAVASSSEPGHSSANAVDNKPATYWLAKAEETNPSLRISLKNTVTFNQLSLTVYGNSTVKAKVEYSTDGIKWDPLCVVSNMNGQPKLFEFDEVTAKQLRYTVTEKTLEAAGLYELELYYDENPDSLLEKAVQAVSIDNANHITGDFKLPLTGLFNVTFDWASENESIIKVKDGDASVTRPETDTTVNLNLKASLSGETITATKPVTVKGTRSSGGGGGSGGTGGGIKGNKGNGGSAGIINLPGATPQVPPQKLYDDVEDTHWAKRYIDNVSANGIMTGRGDHLFEPDANITREEFVKVLMLGFGFELSEAVDEEFADVEKSAWSYPYVAAAKKLGIVNGINENEFGASFNITREDMAVMVVRAAEQKGKNYSAVSNGVTIADQDEISDYAKQSVKILTEASILSGVGENMFAPKQPATRAEVAKIICLLDK